MNALVVYESVYGNTRTVAEAIAEGLDGEAVPVHEVANRAQDVDLLIVGGPTHVHGMTSERSREAGVQAVRQNGAEHHLEPDVIAQPDLRSWLAELTETNGTAAGAFDTRADKPTWLTGSASHRIAKRLRRRGYAVLGMESFRVATSEGPLVDGELERARAWGADLAQSLATPAGEATR